MTEGRTWVDVYQHLERIRSAVENARAMPMSASAVVNRAELLAEIDGLAAELSAALEDAEKVKADREGVIAQGHAEGERLVAQGREERDRLVSDTEVYRVAKQEADRLLHDARRESVELRRETDEYVDSRLANLEVTLGKTLEAVSRGRERLQGRSELDTLGREDVDDILLPGDDHD